MSLFPSLRQWTVHVIVFHVDDGKIDVHEFVSDANDRSWKAALDDATAALLSVLGDRPSSCIVTDVTITRNVTITHSVGLKSMFDTTTPA
jgi:hypothetical protein